MRCNNRYWDGNRCTHQMGAAVETREVALLLQSIKGNFYQPPSARTTFIYVVSPITSVNTLERAVMHLAIRLSMGKVCSFWLQLI